MEDDAGHTRYITRGGCSFMAVHGLSVHVKWRAEVADVRHLAYGFRLVRRLTALERLAGVMREAE